MLRDFWKYISNTNIYKDLVAMSKTIIHYISIKNIDICRSINQPKIPTKSKEKTLLISRRASINKYDLLYNSKPYTTNLMIWIVNKYKPIQHKLMIFKHPNTTICINKKKREPLEPTNIWDKITNYKDKKIIEFKRSDNVTETATFILENIYDIAILQFENITYPCYI